ncbi:MAG TPA: hypothetical protein VHX12_02605 [Acidisoma sp.]|nr:hypothetical protein [Acidisoma sp.]
MGADDSKPVSVKYSEVQDAFEFVSVGMQYEHQAYICINTGAVYCISDATEPEDEPPEDPETSDHCVSIPHRNELGLGGIWSSPSSGESCRMNGRP